MSDDMLQVIRYRNKQRKLINRLKVCYMLIACLAPVAIIGMLAVVYAVAQLHALQAVLGI